MKPRLTSQPSRAKPCRRSQVSKTVHRFCIRLHYNTAVCTTLNTEAKPLSDTLPQSTIPSPSHPGQCLPQLPKLPRLPFVQLGLDRRRERAETETVPARTWQGGLVAS